MIKLHQFAPAWDVPNLSNFCVKVETYLKMAGLPYKVVRTIPLKGPKGKLPFIEDNGKSIGDSRFIIEYLKETYGDKVDEHLTTEQEAVSNAMQRLIEDDLYWVVIYTRWGKRDINWAENKQAIFGALPPVVRDIIAFLARKQILKQFHGQGMGRHSEEQIYHLGKQDLDTLSNFLGEKTWFMGENPTTLDASAFGSLVNILHCPIQSPIKDHLKTLTNLMTFCERMKKQYYSES